MRSEDVAVIGLGATGCETARRLLEHGFAVSVHDLDAWRVTGMVEAGARAARIPADAAEPADLVLVHVPDEAAAEEVLFDCGGVGETLRDGGVVVLATSTGALFVRSAADRLKALGLHTVEAWFARKPGNRATVFAGGSADDLETVMPVLTAVADSVVHVGAMGSVSALRTAVMTLCALPSSGDVDPGRTPDAAALARAVAAVLVDAGAARRLSSPAHGVPAPRNGQHRPSVVPGVYPGVLTLDELMDVVTRVRGREPRPRPTPRVPATEPSTDPTHLGLTSSEFEDVVAELEGRCGIPLFPEARRTSTFAELVALVNSQVTSGV
jgi:glycine/D-amino acid oxidase-like deaminating enzyme